MPRSRSRASKEPKVKIELVYEEQLVLFDKRGPTIKTGTAGEQLPALDDDEEDLRPKGPVDVGALHRAARENGHTQPPIS